MCELAKLPPIALTVTASLGAASVPPPSICAVTDACANADRLVDSTASSSAAVIASEFAWTSSEATKFVPSKLWNANTFTLPPVLVTFALPPTSVVTDVASSALTVASPAAIPAENDSASWEAKTLVKTDETMATSPDEVILPPTVVLTFGFIVAWMITSVMPTSPPAAAARPFAVAFASSLLRTVTLASRSPTR